MFQVKEWKSRKHVGGRAVICIWHHRSKTQQAVTLALSLEEEAVCSLAAKYVLPLFEYDANNILLTMFCSQVIDFPVPTVVTVVPR